jgi:hypothetical protein
MRLPKQAPCGLRKGLSLRGTDLQPSFSAVPGIKLDYLPLLFENAAAFALALIPISQHNCAIPKTCYPATARKVKWRLIDQCPLTIL